MDIKATFTLSTLVVRSEYKNLSDKTLGIQAKLQLEMIIFQNMTQDLEEKLYTTSEVLL